MIVAVAREPVGLHQRRHAERGEAREPVLGEDLQVRDHIARAGGGPPRPRRRDGVEAEADGGVADGMVVQLEAGLGGGDGGLRQPLQGPHGLAAEARPVVVGPGQIARVPLHDAVGEELDGVHAHQRAGVGGARGDRRHICSSSGGPG